MTLRQYERPAVSTVGYYAALMGGNSIEGEKK